MNKFHFYSVNECIKIAINLLRKEGYLSLTTASKESKYFHKVGIRRKIRVSNHELTNGGHMDVAGSIVFKEPTIMPDIEYHVKKAIKENVRYIRK